MARADGSTTAPWMASNTPFRSKSTPATAVRRHSVTPPPAAIQASIQASIQVSIQTSI
jgi:hypothetical protein